METGKKMRKEKENDQTKGRGNKEKKSHKWYAIHIRQLANFVVSFLELFWRNRSHIGEVKHVLNCYISSVLFYVFIQTYG